MLACAIVWTGLPNRGECIVLNNTKQGCVDSVYVRARVLCCVCACARVYVPDCVLVCLCARAFVYYTYREKKTIEDASIYSGINELSDAFFIYMYMYITILFSCRGGYRL